VTEPCLASQWHTLDAGEGTPGGFVRVSESDPRFFEDAAGQWFYPIGQNIHNPYDLRAADSLNMPVLPNRGTFAYDYYFPKLAATGQNTIIMWMSNWWVCIEWSKDWKGYRGLNDYNLGNAWRLDTVFESAARHGIHINLVFDNHGKLKSSDGVEKQWPSNPYNAANGGPARTPEEFFTGAAAFDAYKKRLRYIIGRWGAHPNLLGLQLFSEINLTDAGSPAHVAWMKKTVGYLTEVDVYRRPVSLHWTNGWQAVDANAAWSPELDYVLANAYKGDGSIVPLILEMAAQNARFGKPSFIAEFGGTHMASAHNRLKSDIHCALWSNAMTDSAGAPFCWWYDFIDHYDLNFHFAALAKFMESEDYRGFFGSTMPLDPRRNGQSVRSEMGAVSYIDYGQGKGYVWVCNRGATEIWPVEGRIARHENVEVVLIEFDDGDYDVEYWNTLTGEIIHRETRTAVGYNLVLALPPFEISIAAKIRPTNAREE